MLITHSSCHMIDHRSTPPADDLDLDAYEQEVKARLTRIETKLSKLMNHLGLPANDPTPLRSPFNPKYPPKR